MKAWVLHGIGDIQFEEIKEPQPAEGEVKKAREVAGKLHEMGLDTEKIFS